MRPVSAAAELREKGRARAGTAGTWQGAETRELLDGMSRSAQREAHPVCPSGRSGYIRILRPHVVATGVPSSG